MSAQISPERLWKRVHDFRNLYLASMGLFPQAVAVNPTLTAVALVLNTADALAGAI